MQRICEHIEAANPRTEGWCVKCGMKIPPPSSPDHVKRELARERAMTFQAAAGHEASAEPLITHSEMRIQTQSREYVPDPMLIRMKRNWLKDMREELADFRSYAVFFDQTADPEDLRRQEVYDALRHVVAAYEILRNSE